MTENVNSLKKKAHDLVQKGKHESALKIFNLVVEEDPKDASVHNKIGDILLKLKQDDKAREHFLISSRLYSDEGLQMVALSVCRKIIRAFPDEVESHLIMGNCFLQQDKPDQARKEYISYLTGKPSLDSTDVANALKSLTVLDPDAQKWVTNLAKVAYRQKNEAYLDYAVSISMERNLSGHEKMAQMLSMLCEELHPTPIKVDPPKKKKLETEPEPPAYKPESKPESQPETDTTIVLNNLTFDESDIIKGSSESSDDILRDISANDDENWSEPELDNTGPKRIGEYFVACGMLKAGDVLKALDKQTSDMIDARLGDVLVAMNLVSIRQVREALSKQVADMRNRLERDPGDALGFIEMANLLLDVGDFYGAVGAYLRAAEIYRNEDRDYMVFELLEGVLDICPESLSAAKEIVRIRHTIDKEGQARAFYRLAVAYLLNDSQYEAIASLEAAVEVCPTYRDARDLMNGIRPEEQREFGVTGVADILDDIDNVKTDTSKRALADIIMEFKTGVDASVSREDYSTHFDLGIAYREMGLLRESIQEFERVLVSPHHRIKAREMLGRCTFDMRRYDESEDHFRKGMVLATALEDKNALLGFHVNLSRVYEFTGRSGNAEAEMKLAVEIDPVMAKALILE